MRQLLLLLFVLPLFAANNDAGIFSGRVAKINESAKLVRVKIDFNNMKYLNKKDKVSFWNEYNPVITCDGLVIGKSNDYLLLKVPNYDICKKRMYIAYGGYLKFFSQDLINNLKMGQELVGILLKKRMAIESKMSKYKKEMDSHVNKVEAVNERYRLLREKLELEWRNEIGALEEDKSIAFKNFKALEITKGEIDHKLELYRIEDSNLVEDRWALDSRLYFKK